jgi:hypothetical protein
VESAAGFSEFIDSHHFDRDGCIESVKADFNPENLENKGPGFKALSKECMEIVSQSNDITGHAENTQVRQLILLEAFKLYRVHMYKEKQKARKLELLQDALPRVFENKDRISEQLSITNTKEWLSNYLKQYNRPIPSDISDEQVRRELRGFAFYLEYLFDEAFDYLIEDMDRVRDVDVQAFEPTSTYRKHINEVRKLYKQAVDLDTFATNESVRYVLIQHTFNDYKGMLLNGRIPGEVLDGIATSSNAEASVPSPADPDQRRSEGEVTDQTGPVDSSGNSTGNSEGVIIEPSQTSSRSSQERSPQRQEQTTFEIDPEKLVIITDYKSLVTKLRELCYRALEQGYSESIFTSYVNELDTRLQRFAALYSQQSDGSLMALFDTQIDLSTTSESQQAHLALLQREYEGVISSVDSIMRVGSADFIGQPDLETFMKNQIDALPDDSGNIVTVDVDSSLAAPESMQAERSNEGGEYTLTQPNPLQINEQWSTTEGGVTFSQRIYTEPSINHPDHNEDASTIDTHWGIVCDGMGGHSGGEQHSYLVNKNLAEQLSTLTLDSTQRDFYKAVVTGIRNAQSELNNLDPQQRQGGTTFAVYCIVRNRDASSKDQKPFVLLSANVGDSGVFAADQGSLHHITPLQMGITNLVSEPNALLIQRILMVKDEQRRDELIRSRITDVLFDGTTLNSEGMQFLQSVANAMNGNRVDGATIEQLVRDIRDSDQPIEQKSVLLMEWALNSINVVGRDSSVYESTDVKSIMFRKLNISSQAEIVAMTDGVYDNIDQSVLTGTNLIDSIETGFVGQRYKIDDTTWIAHKLSAAQEQSVQAPQKEVNTAEVISMNNTKKNTELRFTIGELHEARDLVALFRNPSINQVLNQLTQDRINFPGLSDYFTGIAVFTRRLQGGQFDELLNSGSRADFRSAFSAGLPNKAESSLAGMMRQYTVLKRNNQLPLLRSAIQFVNGDIDYPQIASNKEFVVQLFNLSQLIKPIGKKHWESAKSYIPQDRLRSLDYVDTDMVDRSLYEATYIIGDMSIPTSEASASPSSTQERVNPND